MLSNQNLIYQISAEQFENVIKSIHIKTWSPISTFSTIPYFNNKSIQKEPNAIHLQQWQQHNTVYQNSLQPLMSLELNPPSQQQYNAMTQPVPLMPLVLPSYDSPSIEPSKTHTKFRANNSVYNHFNHNPKCYDRTK
ncbi:unnamed protein product [Rotaria magnacalcarata]|nr:unnamed protein product [Rotaria magnacalcarata]